MECPLLRSINPNALVKNKVFISQPVTVSHFNYLLAIMKHRKNYIATILFSICNILPTIVISPAISTPNTTATNASFLSTAQLLNQQGADYLATGKPKLALDIWRRANQIYTILQDKEGIIGTEINQAQAFQSLGFYRQSLALLQTVQIKLQKEPSSELKMKGLLSLGNTLKSLRVLNNRVNDSTQKIDIGAKDILTIALEIAIKRGDQVTADQIKMSLANISEIINTQTNDSSQETAIQKYEEIRNTTKSTLFKVQSDINLYRLQSKQNNQPNTLQFLSTTKKDLDAIAPSHSTIYAYINLAKTIQKNQLDGFKDQELVNQVGNLLTTAIHQSRTIQDSRGEAQALGALGDIYRTNGQNKYAQTITEQALIIAEGLPAPDLAYRLQWQLGKILAVTNPKDTTLAIGAYRQAIGHLKNLRNDLNASDADLQFSFRDSVEPVYRELVDLLLKDESKISTENLNAARDLMESLQVAELENYFRQGCLDTYTVQLDKIDRSATVIYPIVLPDRIAVITSIPNQKLTYHSKPIAEDNFNRIIENIQMVITKPEFVRQESSFKSESEQVYDLLLAPVMAKIQKSNNKTLVFVLDGVLRNIPMSVLYDGNKYLIENYNIALTPGLQLVPPPETANRQYKALLGGISEKRQGYPALPEVQKELDYISKLIPSQKLLNNEFSQNKASSNLAADSSSIVHLATHGEFSSDPAKTFILTWDNQLNFNQLNNLLQNRNLQSGKAIDLLILSACQTATGDNRATLGLAGMAVRARTKSTIASLWSVEDQSTRLLMNEFYQNLIVKKLGKAESLKLAQQSILRHPDTKYRSPFYWAPFVLVGNWQ
jgi:CHAT domain-containing protein